MRLEDIAQDGDRRLPSGLTGKIQTVTGLIDPETVGVCLTHEHLSIDLSDLLPPPNTATARLGFIPTTLRFTFLMTPGEWPRSVG
jgi:hypothetical protein